MKLAFLKKNANTTEVKGLFIRLSPTRLLNWIKLCLLLLSDS